MRTEYRRKTKAWFYSALVLSIFIIITITIINTVTKNDIISINNVTCIDYTELENGSSNYIEVTFKDNKTEETFKVVTYAVYTYNYAYLVKDAVYDIKYEENVFWKPDNLIREIKLVSKR